MDLYLARPTRRMPVPLGMTVVAILGMIVWAFTAQGRAAAASADGPAETALRLDDVSAFVIEEAEDDLDDIDAKGDDESGGGSGSGSGSGSGGHGGGGSDSGGDSSGDGKTRGSSHGGTSGGGGGGGSDSGDDSSGDGKTGGSSHGGTTGGGGGNNPPPGGNNPPPGGNNPPPGGNNPPPGGNNPPPSGGALGGNPGGGGAGVLPDTATEADGSLSVVAGVMVLLAGVVAGMRRAVRVPITRR